ncbi:hypothetical protein D3C76_48200 [compost metagenome]
MDEPTNIWGALGAGIAGLVAGGAWLRTKLSKDAAEIANSRAEVDMITRLQDENRDLRLSLKEVTDERNKLYREVGELVGSIRALQSSQELLKTQIEQLKQEVVTLRGSLERS